ncbi:Uncharacterised protein [Yersinia enterocolitica]|uniref:Uncharacterized protein n=1 Tax=Yersinia enterocolitica TaxID=630 RepID=A0ABM9RVJ3_YEREN|nr:hypothetical protein CH48_2739 [Yersinia enterocolitica]KGA67557.1 hypothetical protein DJ61_3359 [Yersinia enterocolitica]KGA72239.1 hypothetical protein DJ62_1923 [Yersinia enterocolitica]CFV21018.1 Uncharacterised protein [Yersinia enterocolitica]CNB44381.1 Uncharacterised protein [Yersinia enterocolitica]
MIIIVCRRSKKALDDNENDKVSGLGNLLLIFELHFNRESEILSRSVSSHNKKSFSGHE